MYQLYKMYLKKLNELKDKIIKELTREREQSREQSKLNERKLKCELQRVEAELSQFVMNRERSDSYCYDNCWDSKVLCFQFSLNNRELNAVRTNPDILERILYYQAKRSVSELICKEL